jgi:hypothetical protein
MDFPLKSLAALNEEVRAQEERILELEMSIDERLTKMSNLEDEALAGALKAIGESLQVLDQRLAAIEKWRYGK